MGSSRLPGKILMPLAGTSVLQHVIDRVSASAVFDAIVVATTDQSIDDCTAELAQDCGAQVARGNEQDVLGRFGVAAEASQADCIMRITADCPLIDPWILRQMVRNAEELQADVVTNSRLRTFPRGLDAEYFTRAALDIALHEAKAPYQREHVTPFFYEHPDRFAIADYTGEKDYSDLRLTLDTTEDYKLLKLIFDKADDPTTLDLSAIVSMLEQNPQWLSVNAHIRQKDL